MASFEVEQSTEIPAEILTETEHQARRLQRDNLGHRWLHRFCLGRRASPGAAGLVVVVGAPVTVVCSFSLLEDRTVSFLIRKPTLMPGDSHSIAASDLLAPMIFLQCASYSNPCLTTIINVGECLLNPSALSIIRKAEQSTDHTIASD